MTVVDSKGAEEELVMSQYVMENIEGHVKSMQVRTSALYIIMSIMQLEYMMIVNCWTSHGRRTFMTFRSVCADLPS